MWVHIEGAARVAEMNSQMVAYVGCKTHRKRGETEAYPTAWAQARKRERGRGGWHIRTLGKGACG